MKNVFYLISLRCNQFCSKCRHWTRAQDDEILNPRLISDALHELDPIDEFCIVGGEPLLFSESVTAILSATRNMLHRTVIVTNGVLMTPDLLGYLSQFRIHLVVSIDTLDKGFWKYVRGNDSYDVVMRNLDHACRLLTPEQLSIQSVVAKETAAYLGDVRDFCRERGLHHSLQGYVQDGFDGEWNPIDSNQISEKAMEIGPCQAVGRNLSVDAQGNVWTCFQQSYIPGCSNPLGNLKSDSIVKILSSPYSQQVQHAMRHCWLPCRVLRCNQGN